MGEYNINGLAIPLFLLFMLVEYAFLRISGRNLHRYNDSVTSLSMGLCLLMSDALLKAPDVSTQTIEPAFRTRCGATILASQC